VPKYIDLNSLHIPPLHPLVNRHTLKELHTDAILRNPELRASITCIPVRLVLIVYRARHSF
jgi:hypothetical protein